MYHTIITHGGKAHRDEFLACCLAFAYKGVPVDTIRTNAVEQPYMDNPEILVLDIGGDYNPELNNYDHHQLEKAECALSLFVKECAKRGASSELGTQAFKNLQTSKWFAYTKLVDSKGLVYACNNLGIGIPVMETMSPIELAMLDMFQQFEVIHANSQLAMMMLKIGYAIVDREVKRIQSIDNMCKTAKQISIEGVDGVIYNTGDVQEHISVRYERFPEIAFAVFHSNRGDGWTLYRYDDDERVDFSVLSEEEDITFAHIGGFIASTETRCDYHRLVELVRLALR